MEGKLSSSNGGGKRTWAKRAIDKERAPIPVYSRYFSIFVDLYGTFCNFHLGRKQ
jgi:hypothetical protein